MQELMYRTLVVIRPKWVYAMYPVLIAGLILTIQWSDAGWGMGLLYLLFFLVLGFSWFYFSLSLSKRIAAQGKLMVGNDRIELFQFPESAAYRENSMHQSFLQKKLARIRYGHYKTEDYHYMLFESIKGKNLAVISFAAIFLQEEEFTQALKLLKQQTGIRLEQEKTAE